MPATGAFSGTPALGNQVKMYYRYDGEFNTKLPEMRLHVKKPTIEAQRRPLPALSPSAPPDHLPPLGPVDNAGLPRRAQLVADFGQKLR